MWYKNPLVLVYFISFVDLFAIGLTFPVFGNHLRDLGASHTYIGFLSSLYSGLQVVSGPIVGGWTDISDRKSVLKKILFFCAICYAILGLTSSFTIIFIVRFILGCLKHIQSICKAVITDVIPKQDQTEAFGVSSAVSSIGFIVGPFIGGHISEFKNGFAYVSLLTMVLFFINIGFIVYPRGYLNYFLVLVEYFPDVPKLKKNDDKAKEIPSQAGIFNQFKSELSKSVKDVKSIDWTHYGEPFFLRFLFGVAMSTYFGNQVLLLKENYHLSQKHIGYVISYFSTVGLLAAFCLSKINNMFYKNVDFLTKILHFFILMAVSVMAVFVSNNFYVFLMLTIPFSVAATALRITTMEFILLKTSETHRGSLSGASNSVMSISRFISPLLTGLIGDIFGEQFVILFALVPAVLGIGTCFHLKWKPPT